MLGLISSIFKHRVKKTDKTNETISLLSDIIDQLNIDIDKEKFLNKINDDVRIVVNDYHLSQLPVLNNKRAVIKDEYLIGSSFIVFIKEKPICYININDNNKNLFI